MAVNAPSFMLKMVWMTHFVLSSWAQMSGFIGISTYWYTHIGALAFGFWAIVAPDSVDAVIMFLLTMCVSVLNDIMCLALYEPRAHDSIELPRTPGSIKNEYRWALGMAITNLIVKPVSIFLLWRCYQSRLNGSEYTIPGLPENIPGLGGFASSGNARGGYDNMDNSSPSAPSENSAPYHSNPPPVDSSDA